MGTIRGWIATGRTAAVHLNIAELSVALDAIGQPKKPSRELKSAVRKMARAQERLRRKVERSGYTA